MDVSAQVLDPIEYGGQSFPGWLVKIIVTIKNANLAAPWPTGHASALQTHRGVCSSDTPNPALSTS
jgi:hypothetical protein